MPIIIIQKIGISLFQVKLQSPAKIIMDYIIRTQTVVGIGVMRVHKVLNGPGDPLKIILIVLGIIQVGVMPYTKAVLDQDMH